MHVAAARPDSAAHKALALLSTHAERVFVCVLCLLARSVTSPVTSPHARSGPSFHSSSTQDDQQLARIQQLQQQRQQAQADSQLSAHIVGQLTEMLPRILPALTIKSRLEMLPLVQVCMGSMQCVLC